MEVITLSQQEVTRYQVIKGTIDRKISISEAAKLLGISRRQVIEAVVPAINSNRESKSYNEKIKSRKGSNVAKVSTARRLLCIVYRVLKGKDSFKVYRKDLRKKFAGSPSMFYSAA